MIPEELEGLDQRTLDRAVEIARLLRDPMLPALVACAALVVTGLGVLVWTAHEMTGRSYVVLQLPMLVSGGLAAVALVVVGAMLGSIFAHRRRQAAEAAELAPVIAAVSELAYLAAARRGSRR